MTDAVDVIRSALKESGMNLEQFAKKIGVGRSVAGDITRTGSGLSGRVKEVARALDLDEEMLINLWYSSQEEQPVNSDVCMIAMPAPASCSSCRFCVGGRCLARKSIRTCKTRRAKGCPLKPVPEAKFYYEDDILMNGISIGWNACLTEMGVKIKHEKKQG